MSAQLNDLNKNLDSYFEIYNDIISNFDISKKNNSTIQNLNVMNKYNIEFIQFITEIIRDNNVKSKFNDIIKIYRKLFTIKEERNQDNNNIIENEKIKDKNDNNYNKLQKYNPLYYNYENFHINNIQELESYTTKNCIQYLFILNDKRILSSQYYYNEQGKTKSKLCVYSKKKEKNLFVCDINIDFREIKECYQMEDESVMAISFEGIKVLQIKKNDIEVISKFDNKLNKTKKLLNDTFLIQIQKDRDQGFFKFYFENECYSYKKGELVYNGNFTEFYQNENIHSIFQIDEKEFVFTPFKKGKLVENDDIVFCDVKDNSKISSLKIRKGEVVYSILLADKNNLIVKGDDALILVDVNKKIIKSEIAINLECIDKCFYLNEKTFLILHNDVLIQYEFDDSEIKYKEEKEIKSDNDIILKYPENKLIVYKLPNIKIYG